MGIYVVRRVGRRPAVHGKMNVGREYMCPGCVNYDCERNGWGVNGWAGSSGWLGPACWA